MPKHSWEIPINDETSEEDLKRCILEAAHTSDTNITRTAAKAAAELTCRERAEWRARLEFESKERVKAQGFQQGQMDKQLEVADKQATVALRAMWTAAIATGAIAVISAISLIRM